MHLKSLTVRGFKSFASATTFDFEPGVTAVVGPNGSGKSNVVDALAWVMGEQGVKTLRGGKMEDVIFAGTSGRPALGRAQVSLTIDNADGALPIDYSEVTISRTLFRTGGSEYAINGTSCRLLDIQELLSDTGLGREMHVIVGQGQLDKVLHATAEERRGFIEEAAGVLKHRRRKERTLRKLEAMAANLARLTDLGSELRRQLTPLGRQAEVARRAQTVQFDVRDARARLLADDLVQLQTTLAQDVADETALKARRVEVEQSLATGRQRQAEREQLAAAATPELNAARDSWYQLSAARERLRSLGALADDRRQLLGAADAAPEPSRDPEKLQQQAVRVRAEQTVLEGSVQQRCSALEAAVAAKTAAEGVAAEEDKRLATILRAAADRREGLAKLAGQVGAARSRVESAEAELGRLRGSMTAGEERRRKAQEEFTALESQVAGVEEGEETLDADYELAVEELDNVQAQIEDLTTRQRAAERDKDSLTARRDALAAGLRRKDGSQLLLASDQQGVLSAITDLLTIRPGYQTAVAAALGSAADGLAVRDLAAAVEAVQLLKNDDGGRVELIIAAPPATGSAPHVAGSAPPPAEQDRSTATWRSPGPAQLGAMELITANQPCVVPGLSAALDALLAGLVVVDDLAAAAALVTAHPGLRAVTVDGDVFSAFSVRGGSAAAPSTLELQADVDETVARLETATAHAEQLRFALASATARLDDTRGRMNAALERLHESDARFAAVAERLGQLGSSLRSAVGESERLAVLLAAAEANIATGQQALEAIAARLDAARLAPAQDEPSTQIRDELAAAAVVARAAEMEARLGLRSAEEQLKAIANRAASLERAAVTERQARARAAERARRRAAQSRRAAAVSAAVAQALAFAEVSLDAAGRGRDRAEASRAALDRELTDIRTGNEDAAVELAKLTDSVHRDELVRTEQLLRIEALENRAIDELGLTTDHLVSEYGPSTLVPTVPGETTDKWAALRAPVDADGNEVLAGVPFVRAEQEKRLRRAERDLASLGRVNPLALEEFAALEERHRFLSSQLEDLKASRKDLLDIIREVDERVVQVFTAAYLDTAQHFESVFATLFPGGEGKLVLTDPSDMLNTGIEVQARPAGKKIKRLSLLSGGERSLTAVALLVAIFKARPSPFYVMDEVEAALDDTNLGRLLTIFEELRQSSQLIIITHQKRTMEVADALYGVTMRGDGVSTVISQRLRAEA
ncbi:chromosome segregation protein SMC [Paeniglutamicibacter antarcticus]|uniref:Chromosome partition protein Smc n=1 Tax=Arthrobacter terrae TaxID=2935737 RepID=A0A931G4S6_9MICC|nr:chromosome segregation protein SMC [Arthrobacter terrae]MBG0739138.1 chromosome segregation protein SMC [Arthrobacter terrae]